VEKLEERVKKLEEEAKRREAYEEALRALEQWLGSWEKEETDYDMIGCAVGAAWTGTTCIIAPFTVGAMTAPCIGGIGPTVIACAKAWR